MKDLTPKMDEEKRPLAAKRLAEMVSQNYTVEKQLQVIKDDFDHYATKHSLGGLRKHLAYKQYMAELAETAVKDGLNELKVGCAALVPYVLSNLKKAIGKGNVQAMGLIFKAAGIDNETQTKQDTSITVVMSGGTNEEIKPIRDITPETTRGSKT